MLSALQRFTLRKWFTGYCTAHEIDPQTIDFEALVDPQLSYAENKAMFQGLVLLSPEELAFTEQARAMEEQYRAHVEEQRNRAFHRLEEMFRLKPELGHPIFRQVSKTLQVWLRVTDIRRVDVAKVFLRKWGVRFEYRHATYQYKVKNSLGMTSKRNVQRCPPLFGIRIAWSLVEQLQDRLRDAGVNTIVSGVQTPPFLGVHAETKKTYWKAYAPNSSNRLFLGGKLATIAFTIPVELRDFLEAAANLVNECDVLISPSSFQLRSMDPSHIAMVDLTIREEGIEDTPVKTRVILPILAKALKVGLTHLSYDTETKKIVCNGGARKFTIPTLEISSEEVPTPKIDGFDAVDVKLDVAELKVGTSLAPNDNVRIVGDGKEIVGFLNGELTTYEASLGTYTGKPFKATFNMSYLSEIFSMASSKLDAVQKWNLKSAFPVYATFSKSLTERVTKDLTRTRSATLQFWLAPRIEQEDVPKRQAEATVAKEPEQPVPLPETVAEPVSA